MSFNPDSVCQQMLIFTIYLTTTVSSNIKWPGSVITDQYCASGSNHLSVDGIYEFYDGNFDDRSITTGPIFSNPCESNCPLFVVKLYAKQSPNSYSYWIGSSSFENTAVNRISYPGPFQFNPDQFFTNWNYSYSDGKWRDDTSLRVVNCNPLCVSGITSHDLNGRYKWQSFDRSLGGSIYFCSTCGSGTGSYLKPYLNPQDILQWVIQSTMNEVQCDTKSVRNRSVALDVTECTPWRSMDDLHQSDIVIQRCDRTYSPTQLSPNPPLFTLYWIVVALVTVICIASLCLLIKTRWRSEVVEFGLYHEMEGDCESEGRNRNIADDEFIVKGDDEDVGTIGKYREGFITVEGQ
eukprot:545140_1